MLRQEERDVLRASGLPEPPFETLRKNPPGDTSLLALFRGEEMIVVEENGAELQAVYLLLPQNRYPFLPTAAALSAPSTRPYYILPVDGNALFTHSSKVQEFIQQAQRLKKQVQAMSAGQDVPMHALVALHPVVLQQEWPRLRLLSFLGQAYGVFRYTGFVVPTDSFSRNVLRDIFEPLPVAYQFMDELNGEHAV